MTRLLNRRWLASSAVILAWVSCGGDGVEGSLDATGTSVCLPDRRVCITVPVGQGFRPIPPVTPDAGFTGSLKIRIAASTEAPPAALSEAWEIAPSNGQKIEFFLPAQVSFSLAGVDAGNVDQTLLRIYTLENGDWVALDNPRIDLLLGEVQGDVSHLSPFVVLRADRLPDGGLPVEGDAGPKDSGVIIINPFDGGYTHLDAGHDGGHDAGQPDAGPRDAGPGDAGPADAGPVDAGPADAGPADAGPADAGPADAGPADAGPADAGPADAGPADAGPADAGPADAGPGDAGPGDAGVDAG